MVVMNVEQEKQNMKEFMMKNLYIVIINMTIQVNKYLYQLINQVKLP